MCQNLIKYQRIVPFKKTSLKQQVEHHKIQIMESLGENSGPKCSSITVEEHDENLPFLSKCCQTLFTLKGAGKVK